MPQETAANAAQMRRVIIDQIEALAELNRIVARHGRGVERYSHGRQHGGGGDTDMARRAPAQPAPSTQQHY